MNNISILTAGSKTSDQTRRVKQNANAPRAPPDRGWCSPRGVRRTSPRASPGARVGKHMPGKLQRGDCWCEVVCIDWQGRERTRRPGENRRQREIRRHNGSGQTLDKPGQTLDKSGQIRCLCQNRGQKSLTVRSASPGVFQFFKTQDRPAPSCNVAGAAGG